MTTGRNKLSVISDCEEWRSEKNNSRVFLDYGFFPFKLTKEKTYKVKCSADAKSKGVVVAAQVPIYL